MLKIFKYLKGQEYLLLFLSLIFIIVQVWLDLKLPEYMGIITTLAQTPGSPMSEIFSNGGIMILITLLSVIASIIVAGFAAKIGSNLAARLRSKVFNKVQSFSPEEINHFSIASLITRSTNDITQVQMLIVMGLQIVVKSPILAVWAIIKILDKSWQWSFATAVSIVVLLVFAGIFIALAIPKFTKIQTQTDMLNKISRENLTGLRVVRAYNAENYQEDKFEISNMNLTKTNLFTNRLTAALLPAIDLIMNGLTLSVYWIGAVLISQTLVENRLILFSDMMIFSSYSFQLLMAFMMLVMIFVLIPRANVSAKRINEVLEVVPVMKDGHLEDDSYSLKGQIEFKNVSFKYAGAEDYVIKNISFKATKGETVAIIGSTGSGKSTIINLIPRFYDATAGEILVNGINVKDYKQAVLRNKIGYVSQKAVLFKGSILSNIIFGDNGGSRITKDDATKASEIAQAKEFIEKKEEQYDSYIAQGGANLSGGQKQRLAIARAIARKPEILIFDDSFSALDYKTDRILRDELNKQTSTITSIIVAQRIGTIKNADKIIVLEDGEIVGMATHSELMQNCDVYQEIAYSQLSKEELE